MVLVRRPEAASEEGAVDEAEAQDMVNGVMVRFAGQEDAAAARAQFPKPEDTVGIKYTRGGLAITEPAVQKVVIAGGQSASVPAKRVVSRDGGHSPADHTALTNIPSVKAHRLWPRRLAQEPHQLRRQLLPVSQGQRPATGLHLAVADVENKTRPIVVDMLRPCATYGPEHRWNYCGILVATYPVAVDAVWRDICRSKCDRLQGEPWPVQPLARSILAADEEYRLGTSGPMRIRLENFGKLEEVLI